MKLSESQLHNIVRESIYKVLNEDKRGEDAKKRCLAVIRNHFNNAGWLDTPFNHTDNPEGLSHIDYMYKQFMNEFYHDPNYRSRPVMRLAPLFCKLAFEANFQNNNPDTQKLNRLAAILRLIFNMDVQGKNVSSKIDIVNTTFDDLNNQFGTIIDDLTRQENDRMQNTQYERNSNYEVIGPVDYKTANAYGNKSCSTSKLCYTQSEKTWNNYTQDGCNNVYIILQNGWENIQEKHDDESNSAYDTYGLSMIFVFVDGKGDLAYCNTRWNHNANYKSGFSCDHAMSKEMISRLIGANFNEVFKPNNKWKEIVTQIQERLKNGENPKDIFDYVDTFYEEFAYVRLGGKYNFINEQGELLWKEYEWFDEAFVFQNGFAKVLIKHKGWNFINTNGELLWNKDKWFDNVCSFSNGFAEVNYKGLGWNYINTNGELVWKEDKWFEEVNAFFNGFACVKIENRGWNWINTNGELLWKEEEGFNYVSNFHNGTAGVYIQGLGCNFIDTNGELIWKGDKWFDSTYSFKNGFAKVKYNGRFYNLNTKGELYNEDGNRAINEHLIRRVVKSVLREYIR
jgi:hypothetical protein